MHVLACAAAVVECCADCLVRPAPPYVSLHAEHFGTAEEQLDRRPAASWRPCSKPSRSSRRSRR